MAQTITDFKSFLEDAKDALLELKDFSQKEEQLHQEALKLEKTLAAEKKEVNDSIHSTVKKRREEIESSYDAEIGKLQDKLKKVRARREKAKNQGIKERIREETTELYEHNRELKVRMKTLFQQDRVPLICHSRFYYALYFPRGFRDALTLVLTFVICFGLIPYGIYLFLPKKQTLYLALLYGAAVLVFGGLYILTGNLTKDRHLEALKEGRSIRSLMASNQKKIAVITSSIKKDRNETIYDLEKFDDELAQLNQDLEETSRKKKDALNSFENVTKTILADEILGNSRARLDALEEKLKETEERLRYTETIVKEKKIYITDTYESYLGREFLVPEKLEELKKIMESGTALNLSEAMEEYRSREMVR